jgi:N-acetyl-1-D-myo-inositol-2-amino-2-deoxy-alpha-D-glucopyranoside deacetylase
MTDQVERVLFVHAHPDDETISTGATIATLVDRGAEVIVLTCTRGERGEVIPDDLHHLAGSLDELGNVREGELAAALAVLGVEDHRMLGNSNARWTGRAPRRYVDSGMQWGPGGATALGELDALSLSAAEVGEVAADIAAVIIELEPDVVVSYDAHGGYGHPDHVRAHEATRTATEVLGVPFYVIDAAAKKSGQLVVDVAPVVDRKRDALEKYRTQVSVSGDEFSLSSGAPRPILEPERFSRLRAPADRFADHSPLSRIAACALALVLGGLTGATLTVTHQESVLVGATPVPWGIIVALVITAALFAGLRIVFNTRLVVAFAAIGLLGASAWLAVASGAGSQLIPANPAGIAWAVVPAVLAGVAVAWPTGARKAKDKIEVVPAAKGPDSQ